MLGIAFSIKYATTVVRNGGPHRDESMSKMCPWPSRVPVRPVVVVGAATKQTKTKTGHVNLAGSALQLPGRSIADTETMLLLLLFGVCVEMRLNFSSRGARTLRL